EVGDLLPELLELRCRVEGQIHLVPQWVPRRSIRKLAVPGALGPKRKVARLAARRGSPTTSRADSARIATVLSQPPTDPATLRTARFTVACYWVRRAQGMTCQGGGSRWRRTAWASA